MGWILRKLTLLCFWGLVLFSILLAAIVLGIGYVMPYLDTYRPQIERNLSQITGYPVSLQEVDGALEGVDPVLSITGFQLQSNGESAIAVEEIRVRLDTIRSLLSFQPQFTYIRFLRPTIALQETDHQWRLLGAQVKQQANDDIGLERVLGYLSEQKNFSILDANLYISSQYYGDHKLTFPETFLFQKKFESLLTSSFFVDDEKQAFTLDARIEEPLGFLGLYRIEAAINVPEFDLPLSSMRPNGLGKLSTAKLSGKVWLNALVGKQFEVQLADTQLQLGFADGENYHLSAAAKLEVKQDSPSIKLEIDDLLLDDGQNRQMKTDLKVNWSELSQRTRIAFDRLDLSITNDLAAQFIPEDTRAAKMLSGLSPAGTAINGSVEFYLEDQEPRFQLITNLVDSSVQGHNGIPQANHINAVFSLSDTSGYIDFIGNQTQLAFDALYDDAWQTQDVSGYVYWQKQQDIYLVAGRDLHLSRNGAEVQGGFRLEVRQDQADWFALDLHANNIAIGDRLTYVPNNVLGDELQQWLKQSFENQGQLDEMDLVLHTNLAEQYDSHVRLQLAASDLAITFDPKWPTAKQLNGRFELTKNSANAQVLTAQLDEMEIADASIQVSFEQGKAEWLKIEDSVEGDAKDIMDMLSQTPLSKSVLQPFSNWQIEGGVNGRFDVAVPFDTQREPKLNLEFNFNENSLYVGEINLPLTVKEGQLSYSSDSGLAGSVFDMELLGGQSHLTLSSSRENEVFSVLGELQGSFAPKQVALWQGLPSSLADKLSGLSQYQAQLTVNQSQQGQVDLTLSSDLKGSGLDLPDPVGKTAESTKNLVVKVRQHDQDLLIDTQYANLSQGRYLLQQGQFIGGEILLSPNKALVFSDTIPKGLVIKGELDALSIPVWQDDLAALHQQKLTDPSVSKNEPPSWLSKIELIVDQLEVNADNRWHNLKVSYDASQQKAFMVNADEVNFILKSINDKPDLHIGFLTWQLAEGDDAKQGNQAADKPPFAVQDIPSMTLAVDELYINESPYGDWQLDITQQGNTLTVEPITTSLKTGQFSSSLFWQDTGETSNVAFNINAQGKDLAELTKKFSDDAFVSSNSFDINVALSWQGHPFHFDRETLSGRIKFNAQDGNFSTLDELPPFLKVLGIFNMGALSRRLTLDFSDIYEPGLTYDEFKGEMKLEKGILHTQSPVSIISPTAELYLSGKANIVDETLDETLTATFPISGTLPLAGLIWGTPQLAGLLFITDKLIGDQISKVTSVKYKVEGPFSNPVMTPVRYTPKDRKD
ncbi:YhdP family protein [Marinomonas sp. THO17]|uniref:YhdP family protein n=1 Tax=Marinomonas sp. THO17 TaxID=3149048 RepID=UPI00336BCEE2